VYILLRLLIRIFVKFEIMPENTEIVSSSRVSTSTRLFDNATMQLPTACCYQNPPLISLLQLIQPCHTAPCPPPTRAIDLKRKQTAGVPEIVVSSDGQSKSKARRVSTDAQEATHAVASCQTTEDASTAATGASTPIVRPEDSIISIGALIQDLFHSDNAKVKAALNALNLDLKDDKNNCDKMQAVGGCFALVHLM
jgi:hypothetical protein